MRVWSAQAAILCLVFQSLLGPTASGLAVEPAPNEKAPGDKPWQNAQRLDARHTTASSSGPNKPFRPDNFTLSDLVEDLDKGNYFQMPSGAKRFLRQLLASGEDFTFRTHNKPGTFAYISSDLSPQIWINLAMPPGRLGESICHELLHYQDFKTEFKPITSLRHSGFNPGQSKVFHGQVRELINMLSHEYVKKGLEQAGFKKPLVAAMENRMRILAKRVEALEAAFVSVSKQLAARPDKKSRLTIGHLELCYQGLMLNVLRDKLLFSGAYTEQLDRLMRRVQAALDFMLKSTSEDPRFEKLYRKVVERAEGIRIGCQQYHESGKSAKERYALLTGTLDQIYKKVGISFTLSPGPSKAPSLNAASRLLPPGESFLMDGEFFFSKVTVFTPYSPPRQTPG